jgi:outer membrane protein OmpA-like peptidoglycan-associated protein
MKRIAIILAISWGMWISTAQGQEIVLEPATFNSEYSDFSPVSFGEGVVFCSNRRGKILANDVDSLQRFYTDMFFTRKINGEYTEPKLFSKDLTGWLNEGPATFSDDLNKIIYTANVAPDDDKTKNKKKIKEYKLGLFESEWNGSKWSEPVPFIYNDKKANVAHPAMSSGDSLLFFISTQKGGFGGADLYMCKKEGDSWGLPVNMGPEINTPGNELFPFFDESQRLFFSTDGRSMENGMDIYMCQLTDEAWTQPIRLGEPVNSPHDDFGYVHDRSGQHGFVCSDRGESEGDEIFEFYLEFPEFADCDENHKTIYCYRIEEEKITGLDSNQVIYEWDLGDGNKQIGTTIRHCYADTGHYYVQLNIIEQETNRLFYKLAEGMIHVVKHDQPYIAAHKYIREDRPAVFSAADSEILSFEAEEFYWDMGDGNHLIGTQVSHTYEEPGVYRVGLGAVSPINEKGLRDKRCAFLDITVHDGIKWADEPKIDFEEVIMERLVPKEAPVNDEFVSNGWQLLVASTNERIPYNSQRFGRVRNQIVETYDDETEMYSYAVGPTETATELLDIFKELAEAGEEDLEVVMIQTHHFVELQPVMVAEVPVEDAVRVVATSKVQLPYAGYHFAGLGSEIRESYNPETELYTYSSDPVENPEEILQAFEQLSEEGVEFLDISTADVQPEVLAEDLSKMAGGEPWVVVVAKSDQQISRHDPAFADLAFELHEVYDKESGIYTYTTAPTQDPEGILEVLKSVKAEEGFAWLEMRTVTIDEPENPELIDEETTTPEVDMFAFEQRERTMDHDLDSYEVTPEPSMIPENVDAELIADSETRSEPSDEAETPSLEGSIEAGDVDGIMDQVPLEDVNDPIANDMFESDLQSIDIVEEELMDEAIAIDETATATDDQFDQELELRSVDLEEEDLAEEGIETTKPSEEELIVEDISLRNSETQRDESDSALEDTASSEAYSPELLESRSVEVERKAEEDSSWLIILAESYERIPYNHEMFRNVGYEIHETYSRESGIGVYTYSVGPTDSAEEAFNLQKELSDAGMPNVDVNTVDLQQFEEDRVKVGRYIPAGSASALNREFHGLSDIHFEYNSFVIKEESFDNLDYIAAILMLEPNFALHIHAHTCNIGGETFNFRLSQRRAESVMRYLIEKGISPDLFFAQGFGLSQPEVSNDTEEGREQNRRVEFIVQMDGNKKLASQ